MAKSPSELRSKVLERLGFLPTPESIPVIVAGYKEARRARQGLLSGNAISSIFQAKPSEEALLALRMIREAELEISAEEGLELLSLEEASSRYAEANSRLVDFEEEGKFIPPIDYNSRAIELRDKYFRSEIEYYLAKRIVQIDTRIAAIEAELASAPPK